MTKEQKKIRDKICAALLKEARDCSNSSVKNTEPYSTAFWVVGIVLTNLAKTIREELK